MTTFVRGMPPRVIVNDKTIDGGIGDTISIIRTIASCTYAKPVVFLTPARIVDTARASKVKWTRRPKTMLNWVGN